VLDHRAGNADGVAFLEGVLANGVARHLAGNHHHRNGVHVCGGQAGHRIGDARSGSDQRHAHFVRAARVRIGGMDSGLLMANEDVLEFVLLEDGVVDIEDGAAGISENVFYAFLSEAADNDFGARDGSFGIHETFLSRSIGD